MRHIITNLAAPWACLPEHHQMLRALVYSWSKGERTDLASLRADIGELEGPSSGYEVMDGIAVVPIRGTIAQRMSLMTDVSGGTSSDLLVRDLRAAASDPQVRGIVLQVDSPGGAVAGTQRAVQAVRAARQEKKVIAVSDGLIASAAYWIASAAEKIYLSSATDLAGSIGVIQVHIDTSKADEAEGLKYEEIVAGEWKNAESQHAPLSKDGRKIIQDRLNEIYGIFVEDVAHNRNKTVDTVLAEMANGRVFVGRRAVEAGLVDGIASLEEVVDQLRGKKDKSSQDSDSYGKIRTSRSMGRAMTPFRNVQ